MADVWKVTSQGPRPYRAAKFTTKTRWCQERDLCGSGLHMHLSPCYEGSWGSSNSSAPSWRRRSFFSFSLFGFLRRNLQVWICIGSTVGRLVNHLNHACTSILPISSSRLESCLPKMQPGVNRRNLDSFGLSLRLATLNLQPVRQLGFPEAMLSSLFNTMQ